MSTTTHVAAQRSDFAQQEYDGVAFRAQDETRAEYERQKQLDEQEAKTRAALNGEQCAAVYRRLVTMSALLTAAEARTLCIMTYKWGSKLQNCFPSRTTIDKALPRRKPRPRKTTEPWRVDPLLRSCERKGFLRRVHLTRDEAGDLIEVESNQFISAVGYQFLLPEKVVNSQAESWEGPRVWSNRVYAKRSK